MPLRFVLPSSVSLFLFLLLSYLFLLTLILFVFFPPLVLLSVACISCKEHEKQQQQE